MNGSPETPERCPVAAFSVSTDRLLGRAGVRSHRFLRVELEAAALTPDRPRPPVLLAFALDHSGSMAGNKLALAREAVLRAIDLLGPTDAFGIVIFSQEARLLLPVASADEAHKAAAREALGGVGPAGSTALHAGWRLAVSRLQLVERGSLPLRRVILLTDGQANEGPSTIEELQPQVSDAAQHGVSTTCLGLGVDFNEALLSRMAESGHGQFYFVRDAHALDAILQGEMGEALTVVAQGVCLDLCPAPGTWLEALNTYPAKWTGAALRIELGALVSGQALSLVVSARLPAGAPGDQPSVEVSVHDTEGPLELPIGRVEWTLAGHPENDAQPALAGVLRLAALAHADRAVLEAVELNRAGELTLAVSVIDKAMRYMNSLLPNDPELAVVAKQLATQREAFGSRQDERQLKEHHMTSSSRLRDKIESGQSRRMP